MVTDVSCLWWGAVKASCCFYDKGLKDKRHQSQETNPIYHLLTVKIHFMCFPKHPLGDPPLRSPSAPPLPTCSQAGLAVGPWPAVIYFPTAQLQHLPLFPQSVESSACPASSADYHHCVQNTALQVPAKVCWVQVMMTITLMAVPNTSQDPVCLSDSIHVLIGNSMRLKYQNWKTEESVIYFGSCQTVLGFH